MAQLKFKVRHQYIERTDDFYVVAKSVDYLYAKFTCSEEWTGAITAQFKNNASDPADPPYEAILDANGECQVPWEVLQYDNSKVSVTVFCGDLITANAAVVPVYKTAYSEDGESSHEPTPSVYAQIVDRLNKVENLEVEAETLPAGSEASVEKSVDPETGGYVFEFGIPNGQDGFTPTISVTDITGGHQVTITNKTGSMTFDIMDGVSTAVSVQNITGGHRVTITDKTGDHVFDVMDGQDYILTEQDKADIAAMVVVPGVEFHICTSSEYDHTTRIPTIQNPETNIFYLVPAEDGSAPDLFVEWIYANNAWEMFGSATIDLSAYATKVELAGKVDKVTGKGLSTNDYTTEEKNKLSGIEAQANKTVVDDALSSTSTNPVQNKKVKEALDNLDAGDIAYDDTETYSEGTVGDGLSSLKAEINQSASIKDSTKTGVDLDVSDEDGNVILRIADGHIKTKNFDSETTGSDIIEESTESGVDLDVSDADGNVILRMKDGNISTKWFSSDNVSGAVDYNADIVYANTSGVGTITANLQAGDEIVLHFVDANDRISDRIASYNVTYKYTDTSNTEHTIASAYGYDYVQYTLPEEAVSVAVAYGSGLLWNENGTLRFSVYKKGITERMPHIIRVAADGSGNYTSLRSAIDSITDNNAYNRYVVEIYPGTYEVLGDYTAEEIGVSGFNGLFVGDGISLEGVGQKDEVILHGTLDTTLYDSTKRNDISVINIAGNVRLENLTINAENMRYCVHDDTGPLIHQYASKEIINCVFNATTMTTRDIAYGCGISNRRKLHIKGCVFNQELHIHTHNSMTYSPEVIVENCEGTVFSFADYNSVIDVQYALQDCKFAMIIGECSYAPHDQFLFINQIGGTDPMIDCDEGQIYNLANCVFVMGQVAAGQLVNVNRGSSRIGVTAVASKETATGVSIGYIEGNTVVASCGYVNSKQVGLSGLSAGEYITVNSNGVLVGGGTSSNAVGIVKGISPRTNGGAFIKLFV